MDGPSHAGRLLVATPLIGDPSFHRTVVLLLAHGAGGALGIVLNRPTDVPVAHALVSDLDMRIAWSARCAAPAVLFTGGPVDPGALVGVVPEGLVDLREEPAEDAPEEIRLFSGQAGWAPQQLEAEIDEGAWWVCDAEDEDVLTPDPTGLWSRVLRRQSSPTAWFANHPDDLSTG